MARFKAHQKVVCTHDNGGLWTDNEGDKFPGPKFHDIVTVERYGNNGAGFLVFFEYRQTSKHGGRNSFAEHHFQPLMDITELTEILEKQEVEA